MYPIKKNTSTTVAHKVCHALHQDIYIYMTLYIVLHLRLFHFDFETTSSAT